MNGLLFIITLLVIWSFLCFFLVLIMFSHKGLQIRISILVSSLPLIFSFVLFFSNSISVSSIVSSSYLFFFLLIYEEPKKNPISGREEIGIIKSFHEIEYHLRQELSLIFYTSLLFSIISGFPILIFKILVEREITMVIEGLVFGAFLHIFTQFLMILIFISLLRVKNNQHTNIKIKDGSLKWRSEKGKNSIKISKINEIEEKSLRVIIKTNDKKEKIWTRNPSSVSKTILANQI